MSRDSAHDHDDRVEEEAKKTPAVTSAQARELAETRAERVVADALTGRSGEEVVRQLGLITAA